MDLVSLISQLTKEVTNKIDFSKVDKQTFGISDAKNIIEGFLSVNEYGLAYEHLMYVIDECQIKLSHQQQEQLKSIMKATS